MKNKIVSFNKSHCLCLEDRIKTYSNLRRYGDLSSVCSWVIVLNKNNTLNELDNFLSKVNIPPDYTFKNTSLINESTILCFSKYDKSIPEELSKTPQIKYFYPLIKRKMVNKWIPNTTIDTKYSDQWHLNNSENLGEDINVENAWNEVDSDGNAILGTGINIAIVDDGVYYNHPDLLDNYQNSISLNIASLYPPSGLPNWFVIGSNTDAEPIDGLVYGTAGSHGTSAAGVAGAKGHISGENNNGNCVGAAPNCNIVGIKLIDIATTANMESNALQHKKNDIDIYSNSWGPSDNGIIWEVPPLVLVAFHNGTTYGRNGKGCIYTWAGGNGGVYDYSNRDGYTNSIYTIAVAAVDYKGTQSWYSESGSCILISAPSSGGTPNKGITTITPPGGYGVHASQWSLNTDTSAWITNSFGGTSSATPLVSGVVALILQANPDLNWREVMLVLVKSARKNDASDSDWTLNKANSHHYERGDYTTNNNIYQWGNTQGYHINHKYGFGVVDATSAVKLAKLVGDDENFPNLGPLYTILPMEEDDQNGVTVDGWLPVNVSINDGEAVLGGKALRVLVNTNVLVEQVEVILDLEHTYPGDLEIILTSPNGTPSYLFKGPDGGFFGVNEYSRFEIPLTTVRCWGEQGVGEWTIKITDTGSGDTGIFHRWKMRIYGTMSVSGCTGPTYCNYDPKATVDDGSCWGMSGCMNPLFTEYSSFANCDDGSCLTPISNACTEDAPTGLNTTDVIQNRATINWDNMNSDICMVDQYRIKYRVVGTSSWSTKTMGAPVGSCNSNGIGNDKIYKWILNLTPSSKYEYQMKAWYCDGGSSAWSAMETFTTLDDCPNVGNLTVTSGSTTQATFTWDNSNGAYSFMRIKARVDVDGSTWFNVGGMGVAYGVYNKNKNNLSPGTTYRAQARTWCDPHGGAYKSPQWTSLLFWTQPKNSDNK